MPLFVFNISEIRVDYKVERCIIHSSSEVDIDTLLVAALKWRDVVFLGMSWLCNWIGSSLWAKAVLPSCFFPRTQHNATNIQSRTFEQPALFTVLWWCPYSAFRMVLDLHTAQDKKQCSLSHDVGTNSVFFHSPYFALSAVCMSGYLTVLLHFAHGKEYTVQTSFLTLLVRNRGLKLLQEGCVVCACNLDYTIWGYKREKPVWVISVVNQCILLWNELEREVWIN